MKLLLLTCLVVLASAAPSTRIRRNILPGDLRYDPEHHHHHEVHEHHQNEAEIARALGISSGCLSPLAFTKGHGVHELKPETPSDSTDVLKPNAETGSLVKVFNSVDAVSQTEDTAVVKNLATTGDQDFHSEVEPEHVAEPKSHPENRAGAQKSSDNSEHGSEVVESHAGDSHDKVETEHAAESDSHPGHHTEAQEPHVPSFEHDSYPVKSHAADSHDKVEAEHVAESDSLPEHQTETEETYVHNSERDSDSHPEHHTETQETHVHNSEHDSDTVKSHAGDSHDKVETEHLAESDSHPAHHTEVQEASVHNSEHDSDTVKSQAGDSHDKVGTEHPAESDSHPAHHTEVQEASVHNSEHDSDTVKSQAGDSHDKVETEHPAESDSHPEHHTEAQEASVHNSEHDSRTTKSHVEVPHHQVETEHEVKPTSHVEQHAEAQTPSSRQFGGIPQLAKSQVKDSHDVKDIKQDPIINTKSSVEVPSKEANSANGSPATPFQSNFGSPFGSVSKSGFGAPISPSYPLSPFSATSFYDPGFNAFDHGRYNPSFHSGLGYAPGFSGHGHYNNNYGRLGYNGADYYPAHPVGYGTYPGFDQGVKGKTVINPHVGGVSPYTYPVDYTKNIPYAHPQPFPFHSAFPIPQPVVPFLPVQQTEEQNVIVKASQDQQQLSKGHQRIDSFVQPTVDPFKQSAAVPVSG